MRGLNGASVPALIVVSPGLSTTVQDLGRRGWQHLGIPVSGAIDRVAFTAANIVAGNPVGAAGLECLYQGPELVVRAESARCALAGDGAGLDVFDADGALVRRCASLESTTVHHGERVRVQMGGRCVAAYLAVEGGVAVAPMLGSRATYGRSGFGGHCGRALRAGDRLPLALPAATERPEVRLPGMTLAPAASVRVVLGPQGDLFEARAIEALVSGCFRVRPASDRMGLRLAGPRLAHKNGADIATDAIPPGAIQVPGHGQPIVMLADRQTTGGYAKIATVISADLPTLGRMGPGAALCFEFVTVEVAEELAREQARDIAGWSRRLIPIGKGEAMVEPLAEVNLISGFVDGYLEGGLVFRP